MNGRPLVQILSNAGHLAAQLVPDQTTPTLNSYDLDMNTGVLTLTFSEIVNAASFNIDQVVLQGQSNVSAGDLDLFHRLSPGTLPSGTMSSQANSVTITVSDFGKFGLFVHDCVDLYYTVLCCL